MKLLVIGDMDFDDYPLLKEKLDKLTANADVVEVILDYRLSMTPQGDAKPKGVTFFGMLWALEREHAGTTFRSNIDLKQHSANSIFQHFCELISPVSAVIAFTNGKDERCSKTLGVARQLGKTVRVYSFEKRGKRGTV
jgi:hypothetical protein